MPSHSSFFASPRATGRLCVCACCDSAVEPVRRRQITRRLLLLMFCVCTFAAGQTPPAQTVTGDHRIQVLIITGQDKHPWRDAAPYLKDLLNQTGKYEVRVTEEFRGATTETLAPYDVAVLVYSDEKMNIPEWSDTTKNALLDFVRSGRGLVVYHHSAASFQQWTEYKSLVGCVWRTGVSHHAPVHDYTVDVRDADHPIMRGMASSFSAHQDELYAGLECIPRDQLDILATGFDDHTLYKANPHSQVPSGPSQDEPLLWTHMYGKGRVFAIMLGNDMRAVHTAGFCSTFVRGTEWAATGAVSILPAPEVSKASEVAK
jgi:type 1 glutamine amidotransferase